MNDKRLKMIWAFLIVYEYLFREKLILMIFKAKFQIFETNKQKMFEENQIYVALAIHYPHRWAMNSDVLWPLRFLNYPHRWAHERFPVTSTRKPGRRSLISRLPLRCALWRGIIYKLSTYPSSCRAEPALHFSGSRCHLLAYGHCTQRRSGNFFFIQSR